MVNFSIKYELKYKLETFNDVKDTYYWIIKAIQKLKLTQLRYNSNFMFYLGRIRCSCDSIDEFIQNAYGGENFKFIDFNVNIYDGNNSICYLGCDSDILSITSSSKIWLEKIVKFLDETNLHDDETPINNINIVNQYNQSGTIIQNGDGNTVEDSIITVNSHDVNISTNASEQNEVIDFFKGVWQGICANWIWWILGILGVSFLSYIVGNK